MSYPGYNEDYPVYNDYHRHNYNKSSSYFNYNSYGNDKVRQELSPIIVFNDHPIKSKLGAGKRSDGTNSRTRLFTESRESKPAIAKKSKRKQPKSTSKMFSIQSVLKVLIISICCGFCLYQSIDVFHKYSSFPMDVNVVVDEMKLLKLPGITICNNNVLKRSELFERVEGLEEKSEGNLTKEVQKKAKDFIKKAALNDLLDLGPTQEESFYDWECDSQFDPLATDENKMIRCKDKEVIRSLQKYGTCFTYFHALATTLKQTDKRDCKMLGTCTNTEPIFDTNEVVRFEVNFRPDEYTTTELPVSGRISLHDNWEIGNSLSNAYNLEPGYYYQFFIKIQSTAMLKKPYATNCFNYSSLNAQTVNETRDFTRPLCRKQCATECISKYNIDRCNCWPPELAYTSHNGLDKNHTLKWCSWRFSSKANSMYGNCYGKAQRMRCAIGCQPNCLTDNYEISVQKLPFEYYGRDNWKSDMEDMVKCCAVVSVRYWSTEHTIHKYSPLFTILDLFCYVGGLVSMYTGLSLIAIYDFLTIIFLFTKKYF